MAEAAVQSQRGVLGGPKYNPKSRWGRYYVAVERLEGHEDVARAPGWRWQPYVNLELQVGPRQK